MSKTSEKVSVQRLKLQNFRNYSMLDAAFDESHVVLTGHNGAGKTNILEALSLLSPGRGLRRSAYNEIASLHGSGAGFSAFYHLQSSFYDSVDIGTGVNEGEGGRRFRINGATASADDLSQYCRVTWLVPSQDGLFTGSSGERRRFVDRMVLAVDPAHGQRVTNYEKAMRSRNRLLSEGSSDSSFLAAYERSMAELGVAIAAGRVELIHLLNNMIEKQDEESPFPKSNFRLDGLLENEVSRKAAIDVEEMFRDNLVKSRPLDRAAGRTLEGPHRTDFIIYHAKKNMKAALSSTGEQKALLTGIILAHARLISSLSGFAPILLLDEIAAHLDRERLMALFDILDDLNAQAFMTGTDAVLFSSLEKRAQFFDVSDGQLIQS